MIIRRKADTQHRQNKNKTTKKQKTLNPKKADTENRLKNTHTQKTKKQD